MRYLFLLIFVVVFPVFAGCNPLDLLSNNKDAASGNASNKDDVMPAYPDARAAYDNPSKKLIAELDSEPEAKPEPEVLAQEVEEPSATSNSPVTAVVTAENLTSHSDWCYNGCKKIFECEGDMQAQMGGVKKFRKNFGKTREDCNSGCLKEQDHVPTTACKKCIELPCEAFSTCVVDHCFPAK